jgi:hypothetical protein
VQDAHYRKQSQGNISTTAYTGLIKQLDLSKSVSPEKKSMFTKQIDDVSKEIRAAYFSKGEGSPSWTYNERTGKREQVYDLGPAGNAAITDFRAAAMRKMLDGTLDKKFNEDKSVEYLRSLAFSGKPIEGYKPIKGGQSTIGVNDIGVLSEQLKTIGDTIKNKGSSLPIDEVRRLKSEFDRVNNQIKQIQQGTAIKEAVPKKDVKGRKFIPIEGEDE